jgi:hypothetical protein
VLPPFAARPLYRSRACEVKDLYFLMLYSNLSYNCHTIARHFVCHAGHFCQGEQEANLVVE